MSSIDHTAIATALLMLAYLIGHRIGTRSGIQKGAEKMIMILEAHKIIKIKYEDEDEQ